MVQRDLDIPLPADLDCPRCLDTLHVRLLETRGVDHATIDRAKRRLLITLEDTPGAHARTMGALASFYAEAEPAGRHVHEEAPGAGGGAPARDRWTPRLERPVGDVRAADYNRMASQNRKRLLMVLVAGLVVAAAEAVGGFLANSLVLLADAAHYATDLLAILLAFLAVSVSMRAATRRKTFGFQRAEVLAAFVQALGLWAVSAYFLFESWRRFQAPPEVDGLLVAVVGGASLVVNAGLAWILQRGPALNLNVRAAYLHILSDVLGSVAALVGGLVIHFTGMHVVDPLLTILITVLILAFAVRLTRQTIHILLEGAPHGVDPAEVEAELRGMRPVLDVHDLHVWTLTSGVDSLSAHVVLSSPAKDDRVAHSIHERIRDAFNIHHITIQLEDPQCACDTLVHSWQAT